MSTTPRTDAAWSATFDGQQMSAGRTARALRECSQQLETELTALTAERDQLRAALALGQINCDAEYDDLRTERDAAKVRAERAEASLAAAKEECTDVRLKWHAVMGMCAAKEDSIMEADEELVCLRARAELAEADAERYRLVTLRQDAELAKERARLDWLLQDDVTRFDVSYHDRSAIDAGMKEAAK